MEPTQKLPTCLLLIMVFLPPRGSHYPDTVDPLACFYALCKLHLKQALFSFWVVFLDTVLASDCVLFLLIAVDDCIVWIYHRLFIHSTADRTLGSIQVGFMKTCCNEYSCAHLLVNICIHFPNVKPILRSWNKPYVSWCIMLFICSWIWFLWNWLWDYCIYVTERNSSGSFLFFNVLVKAWCWVSLGVLKELGSVLSFSFFSPSWVCLFFLPWIFGRAHWWGHMGLGFLSENGVISDRLGFESHFCLLIFF